MMERNFAAMDFSGPNRLRNPEQDALDEIERRYNAVMANSGKLTTDKVEQAQWSDLKLIGFLAHGSCGHVSTYKYNEVVMAVKQMPRNSTVEHNRRVIMDLDIYSKTGDCPNIVRCYGYFIANSEVRICMEPMVTCLDHLLKNTDYNPIPEKIIGKIVESTINALSYLKDKHNVIHRDVKPSNILIGLNGSVKLCDFGISGILMESKAHTRQAGCYPYMGPERLDPDSTHGGNYDIRSDVWSLGITMIELATGRYPYTEKVEFLILTSIINKPAPVLRVEDGFSAEFCDFVAQCLKKSPEDRPKYNRSEEEIRSCTPTAVPPLLEHPFMIRTRADKETNVDQWFRDLNTDEV